MVRNDIKKVLIIGSGPIVIGQACEFDYSGTQACKALRGCGYKIVLVNSNPATIMTDPVMADATYIEPLNVERLEQIIAKERPDALLPNLGGQTGLNLAMELSKKGILEKYGVKVIGVNLDAIERGEDRQIFKDTMTQLGIEMPESEITYTLEHAEEIAAKLGYPVVVRPAYTMGGTGGGLVYNVEELRTIVSRGLEASLTHQCLIEESVLGWEELEVEVVRDAKNQMISVCFIENIDPMGVHTGDSFCSAPMLTIAKPVQDRLQEYAFRIVESIGVIGGTNVQFAHDPQTGRIVIIEINPRTSRSSALASKATGFPIAMISAKLASGMTMDEIPYWRDGTLEKYTPSGDYIVIKFSRWAFEKFRGVEDKLGTQMKAVGEVMSIGKTYKETFQKAIRALENGRHGLGFAKDYNKKALPELLELLLFPTSERQFIMYEAIRKGATNDQLFALTKIKHYFVQQMRELVELEERLLQYKGAMPPDELLIQAKKDGFSDKYLTKILGVKEKNLRLRRTALGVTETWHPVPVSGVENSYYYYSSYNAKKNEVPRHLEPEEGHDPRRGPEPHRPGHRVRLLLCPRRLRHARRGLRDHHGQLQPRDRLDRLRHVRQALFRAGHAGRRAPDLREREARRRHRAVRRPDAPQHRARARRRGRQNSGHQHRLHRHRRGP
jgi:carbamoyl-phosphate synthase large subunit